MFDFGPSDFIIEKKKKTLFRERRMEDLLPLEYVVIPIFDDFFGSADDN